MENNINNNNLNDFNNNINNNEMPNLNNGIINNEVVNNNETPIEDEEFQKKRNKRVYLMSILGAIIITVSIIIIAMSGSYAYFINEVEHNKDHIENEKVTLTSGDLKMSFTSSNYINWQKAGLVEAIDDSKDVSGATNENIGIDESKLKASGASGYTDFTIAFGADSTVNKAKYSIYLTDLEMTENFKSKYLKWALYKVNGTGDTNNTLVKFGDFSSVLKVDTASQEDSKTKVKMQDVVILASQDISKGTGSSSDKYRLYLWLENSKTENQISLLEGQLSVKVGFRAVTSTGQE